MRLALITFLVIVFAPRALAQKEGQARLESLLATLPHITNDTQRLHMLFDISESYYNANPDEGIGYGIMGLVLSGKPGLKKTRPKC